MGCSNCFNGCADIVSDQCVKYTGIDVPELGITTGDPLLVVENQIVSKILELITGEGIIPIIEPSDLCALVSSYLPVSGDITLNQVISALFQTVCALDTRVTDTEAALAALNADYDIDCLEGVVVTSDTHEVLQAAITKLCEINNGLTTLAAELVANYVLIGDINEYISAYLADQPISTLYSSKMIPYVAVPYFGPTVGFFDITGAGIGDWAKIYLCNGQNLTPDMRGRTLVGNTTMGNTAFNPAVDPAIAGNPTYGQGDVVGANLAVLTSVGQIPSHTHTATLTITDPGHIHTYGTPIWEYKADFDTNERVFRGNYTSANTNPATTGLKGNGNDPLNPNVVVTIGSTGGSSTQGHNNIQPVLATNFIIYIP